MWIFERICDIMHFEGRIVFMNNIQLDHKKIDISINQVTSVFHKARPENFRFKQINSNNFRLCFVISGSAIYDFGNKQITVQANDLLFIRKNQNYTVTVTDNAPWEHIVISFDLQDDCDIDSVLLPFINKLSHPAQFEEIFKKILITYNHADIAYNLEMKSLTYHIFSMLLEELSKKQASKKPKYKAIEKAARYIENNYKEKISVDILAKCSGYSTSNFSRLFKEIYSLAPAEYVNHIRIEKAKNMLKTEMFTLAEIAEECGFSNVYYFSRVFKKLVGVTPKTY